MPKRVLVAGGAKSLVFGNLSRKMAGNGLTIEWHVTNGDWGGEGSPFTGIPQGCEAVVIIRDMVGHLLWGKVNKAAKVADIPCAAIPRKWSQAEGILRMQGVLDAAPPPDTAPPEEDVSAVSHSYIVDERRKGRVPKLDEVKGALFRALGTKVPLTFKKFRELCSKAAQEAPELGQEARERREMYDWSLALIESDPTYLNSKEGPDIASDFPQMEARRRKEATQEARKEAQRRFGGSGRQDVAWRRQAMKNWLVRRYREEGKHPQSHRELRAEGLGLFGKAPHGDLIREARVAALGEWASHLLPARKAAALLQTLGACEVSAEDIRRLAREGKLKALYVGTENRLMTSGAAIEEMLANAEAVVSAPPPEEAPPLAEESSGMPEALAALQQSVVALEALLRSTRDELSQAQERVRALEEEGGQLRAQLKAQAQLAQEESAQVRGRLGALETCAAPTISGDRGEDSPLTLDALVRRAAHVEINLSLDGNSRGGSDTTQG